MKELKPVVTQKLDCEYSDESIRLDFFFQFANHQNFDTSIKMNDFSVECFLTSWSFSFGTLMEDVKPIVKENFVFN